MRVKTYPLGIDREMTILGYMLIDEEITDRTLYSVHFTDFMLPLHRHIYRIIQSISERGESVCFDTVLTEMKSQVITEGEEILACLIKTAREIVQTGLSCDECDNEEEEARKFVLDVVCEFKNHDNMLINTSVNASALFEILETGGKNAVISTGFKEVDFKIGGLSKGILTVLASRQSQGKTLFSLDLARKAAMQGAGVCIFPLKERAANVFEKIVCTGAGINVYKFKLGISSSEDTQKMKSELKKLDTREIFINEDTNITAGDICNQTRLLFCKQWEQGKTLNVIIIDGLHLIKNCPGQSIRETVVRLRDLARELNVHIILTVRIKPKGPASYYHSTCKEIDYHRPSLEDVKEIPGLVEFSDNIFFLYRAGYYCRNDESLKDSLALIAAKNSCGPESEILLKANFTTFSFKEENYEEYKDILLN